MLAQRLGQTLIWVVPLPANLKNTLSQGLLESRELQENRFRTNSTGVYQQTCLPA